jgi:hypothetical protein
MSRLFALQSSDSHASGNASGEAFDRDCLAGRYLTDGVNLYRSLGPITPGPSQVIGLEDCRSLDVILIAADEFRGHRLRQVIPMSANTNAAT